MAASEQKTAPGRDQAEFRQRLLDGLALSIREIGLQRTQINDIVRNARTSNRTFYECFPNKAAAFVELIDRWAEEVSAGVQASIDPEAPWGAQVEQTVDAYLAILSERPELTVTVTRELPSLGERGVKQQETDIDRYVALMMAMTRGASARHAGVEPVDEETAAMLIGGIAEILDRAIRAGRTPDSIGPTAKHVIKRVLGPGPA